MHDFCPNEDNTGIVRVKKFNNEDTQAQKIANERIKKGITYNVPSILELKTGKLTDEQIVFFFYRK